MVKVKFIPNTPASLITTNRGREILTISDLHIGVEYELETLGFKLPSQTQRVIKALSELLSATKPDVLAILGDLKHKIGGFNGKVRREVQDLIRAIMSWGGEVVIIMGNHDGSLKKLGHMGIAIHRSTGVSIDDVSLIHGNAWPHPSLLAGRILLMGHLHPILPRRLGARKVWVIYYIGRKLKERMRRLFGVDININRLIVHPAYSNYSCYGELSEESFRRLSPLFRKLINPARGYIYDLDGNFIGKLSSLSSGTGMFSL
ncbi:MAG: metallophosphoesterase [Candidatus Nezhaarchaeota archaeon]|nr:metallophosphoesterase [Candidatus Nezhaarchaeota archaeon]MCX8142057.1 metallophosphoesterase [Candidatus Nezhaarchaeota archaeon]MDW8050162.1 metallophosphoesterase [Nitrososphaerota archaeon]